MGNNVTQKFPWGANGTMFEFEGMQLNRVGTDLSARYVDHNLLQEDFRNPVDHLFLFSACRCFDIWFSRAGNGVSPRLTCSASGALARRCAVP